MDVSYWSFRSEFLTIVIDNRKLPQIYIIFYFRKLLERSYYLFNFENFLQRSHYVVSGSSFSISMNSEHTRFVYILQLCYPYRVQKHFAIKLYI